MEINALMMDVTDNVVTCVNEVEAGEMVVYRKGDEICTIKAEENIPYCHKIALVDIAKGAEVIKYGEVLGETSEEIKQGHWVSHNNLFSVPRDYDAEMIEC
ncbi:MAG: hydrolase [Clostridia bacterium]|nr:hydrolase [Clostridia bacterium]NCC44248.1 hydrolase [Clostridia bacterium]